LPPPKKLTREEEIQLREAYEAKQAERLRIASRISKVDHEQVLDSSARQIVASPQS
jgi:hypothetical protein